MSSDDRLLRKQARTRGSGNRNVQLESFSIVDQPLSSKQRKLIDELQSALIDSQEIYTLPRLRSRRSTMNFSATEENIDIQQDFAANQNIDFEEDFAAEPDAYQDNLDEEKNSSPVQDSDESAKNVLHTPPRSQTNTRSIKETLQISHPNETKPATKTRTKSTREHTTRSNVAEKSSRRGSNVTKSRLLKSLESSFDESNDSRNDSAAEANESTESANSRFLRIRANVKRRHEQYNTSQEEPKENPRPKRRTRRTAEPSLAPAQQEMTPTATPIPLSKTRANERQKPLTVDIERITNNANKMVKVNTIDVLKSLVVNFQPKAMNRSLINEAAAQQDFKNHLIFHLDALLDMYASINDITQSIKQVQKDKDNLRQRIFELREDHNKVGQELNNVRNNHRKVQDQFDKVGNIERELIKLRTLEGDDNVNGIVQQQLHLLNKIINPELGIFNKLSKLNDKLTDIEQDMN